MSEFLSLQDFERMFSNAITECYEKYKTRRRIYGDSWQTCNISYLQERFKKEIEEFKESKSKDELVDIANFCLMLIERSEEP